MDGCKENDVVDTILQAAHLGTGVSNDSRISTKTSTSHDNAIRNNGG